MLRNVRKKINEKKKKKGFTLIELIIVIAILAILAAVALPKFGAIRENANKKADISNAKNIHTAVSVAITESNGAILGPNSSVTGSADASISPLVEKWEIGKTKGHQTDFTVATDANGDAHISLNGDEVYPNTSAAFN